MTIEITAQELRELTATTPAQQAAKDAEKRYRERVDRLADLQRKIARLVNASDTDPSELARLEIEAAALTKLLPNSKADAYKAKEKAAAEQRAKAAEKERPALIRQRLAAVKADRQAMNASGQIATWQANIRQMQAKDRALADQIAGLEAQLQTLEGTERGKRESVGQ